MQRSRAGNKEADDDWVELRTENALKGLRVCYFGHYDPDYIRNRIIAKALRRAGAEIIHMADQRRFLSRNWGLLKRGLEVNSDLMLIGFPGHTDVPIGRLISEMKGIPLVFDAFISLYDSSVFDRGTVPSGSFSARRYRVADKIACALSDIVLLDTNAHISYFAETFNLPNSKFRRIRVSADEEFMYPQAKVPQEDDFTVFFYGSFVPLQGVEYIIEAAKNLEDKRESVQFVLAGSGQTFPKARDAAERLGVRNIRFLGRVPYHELPKLISQSHVCLGIFGATPKAQRVIPNKLVDALAIGRPVITADTQAIREVFSHGENVWLCEAGSGESLATAIVTLKRNSDLRDYLGLRGHDVFKQHFSIDAISKELVILIEQLLNRSK